MLRVKFERTYRELHQEAVAVATRIHQPQLSLIENGRLIPTPQQLQRLADFFRVPAERLLENVVVVHDEAAR